MLVVNDAPLAEAIGRLRGEWAERAGGSLDASSIAWSDLIGSTIPEGDVIIFPSRYLGELCEMHWLRPVRDNVLENEEFDAQDIFPLVRQQLMTYDDKVMAVPLGIDLPSKNSAQTQPAIRYLAMVAPYAVHRDQIGVFFNSQTMQPRIVEPPFVRALEELQESSEQINGTFAHGSQEVYNRSLERWEKLNEMHRVPLLGVGDRLAAVTTSSRNGASAFQLLAWLASPEISSQLARAGLETMPVRRSLAASPEWYDRQVNAKERSDLAKVLKDSLTSDEYLLAPRIPGVDEYMAVLAEAVEDVGSDDAEPEAALQKAAAAWEQITEKRGREAQLESYLKHLGIED